MDNFLTALNWFVIGAFVGYCWHPILKLIQKIFTEVQQARKEW
jgi:hypothetical protein